MDVNELTKLKAYPRHLVSLLIPISHALKKALEFWAFANFNNEIYDRSHWDMASISPHSQNRRYRSWVILIELCRDLWEATWEDNREKAQSILGIWRSFKYPLFRRLTLHAMTFEGPTESDVKIDYLLEDNGQWLWALETRREVFRLLAVLWPELNKATAVHLVNTILQGPPREMYRADLTAEEWDHIVKSDIWLMLSKLDSFGGILPTNATETLKQIKSEYPKRVLQEGDRDEFNVWMETGSGHEVDITIDEIFAKDIPDLVDVLSQESQQYAEGRLGLFRIGCKDNSDKAIETLKYLSVRGNWDRNIWHAGLVGLADSDDNTWEEIAPLLQDAMPEFYSEEAWAIAHWTNNNVSSIKCGGHGEHYFGVIFELLLNNSVSDREEPIRDAVNYAINHPIGIITEALIDRLGACKLEFGGGIPDGPLGECLNKLFSSKTRDFLAGKIILASRLHYFHTIDPIWTEKKLIPLFEWKDLKNAALYWQGYLWNPRISADLAFALKKHLANAIKNANKIGVKIERLIQLFTIVCLEFPDLYKGKEQHDVLVDAGAEGFRSSRRFFLA